jgi:hypothetical protein
MNTYSFTYPKGTVTTAELTKKIAEFRANEKSSRVARLSKKTTNPEQRIKGVKLVAKHVAMIHGLANSKSPLRDAVSIHEVTPDEILGSLSTSLITLDFVKMQGAYKKALTAAKTDADKKALYADWMEGVDGFKSAYATIGLKGLNEKTMLSYSSELLKNKNAFNSLVNINNTKVAVKGYAGKNMDEDPKGTGKFETEEGTEEEPLTGNLIIPKNACSIPLVQGGFTKHFEHTFNLSVTISLPCIKGWGGLFGIIPKFGWCRHTYNLASLSYNVDLNIGYKVTCCGGMAWGYAAANVCASLLGKQFCAGCSAGIVGVIGIGRAPSGSNCVYGLGLKAELKCTFGKLTIVNLSYPFGYTITGPCPPLPC